MQVSVENVSSLERLMTVQLPSSQVDEQIDERLKKIQKQASLKGFRPGKVPAKLIKQRYEDAVRHEIVKESISKSLQQAIEQEKLDIVSQPIIDDIQAEPGKDIEYKAKFEVHPEVTIADLSKIKVEKPTAEISDEDVQRVLDKLQKQSPNWVEVERASKQDDQVTIDFTGLVAGEPDDRLNGNDVKVEIGAKQMMDGFEDGLLKLKAGGTTKIELEFPKEHTIEQFKGKPVVFDVTVKTVCEPQLPELNEEFFKKFSDTAKDLESFTQELREQMQVELDKKLKTKHHETLFNALLDAHTVELPNSLLEQEIKRIKDSQYKGVTDEALGQDNLDKIKENAEKNLAMSFVVQEISKQNDVKIDNKKLSERIDEIAQGFHSPEEAKQMIFSDEKQLDLISSYVLQEQVIEFILSKVAETEQSYTYEDIVNI